MKKFNFFFIIKGANEESVINIILSYSNNQRQLIKTKYQVLYKQVKIILKINLEFKLNFYYLKSI